MDRISRLKSGSVNVEPIFQSLAFDTITEFVFGKDVGCLDSGGSSYLDSFNYCLKDGMVRFILSLNLPSFMIWESRKYKENIKHFRSLVTDKLEEYHKTGKLEISSDSILGTMLSDGKTPESLKRESTLTTHLITLLFAGHVCFISLRRTPQQTCWLG